MAEDPDTIATTSEPITVLLADDHTLFRQGLAGILASSLHLSESTLKRHPANIYPKMGVSSRGEAARKALREDWFTIKEITEPGEGG